MSANVPQREWRDLMDALGLTEPTPDYKVLELATKRIKYLEAEIKQEHEDCCRIARQALPNTPLHFAHQACWAMAQRINELTARLIYER